MARLPQREPATETTLALLRVSPEHGRPLLERALPLDRRGRGLGGRAAVFLLRLLRVLRRPLPPEEVFDGAETETREEGRLDR